MQLTPQNVSKAITASFGKFDHFRKARGRFMSQMVSRFYSRNQVQDKEDKKASPLNLLHTAVTTLVPNLVYGDPRVKVRTDILAYRQYADNLLSPAINSVIKKTDLRTTLREVIFDAIFMAGFIKTGIATGEDYAVLDGDLIEVGEVYAKRVDPDDIILDPLAKSWDEQSFIGNRFRANLDDLIASGLYDEEYLENLSNRYEENNKGQAERLTETRPEDALHDVQRFVDLCEIYLPREKVVLTIPYSRDGTADKFLRIADYDGPRSGPYHMLAFTPVSDNILPVAPAMIWYDLHILGNRIARKLSRQAERLKRVLIYNDAASEDVETLAEADDGETVKVGDINNIKELTLGGATAEAYQWMQWVKSNFSDQANSMDQLSGSGTGGVPTATQAEMLQANGSVRMGDMQGIVYLFTAEVTRDIGFYLHTDPLIQLPLVSRQRVVDPATGQASVQDVQVHYTPEMRQGEAFDYTYSIEPYSMAKPDPNMAVRRKLEFAQTVIPAAAQATMMLGPGFKIGPFLRRMAMEVGIEDADEWLDDPSFEQWIMQKMALAQAQGDPGKAGQFAAMPPPPMMPGGPGGGQPNPGQPNPGATGPTGGISPGTEQAMAQQETAGELQGNKRFQPSVKSLALSRG